MRIHSILSVMCFVLLTACSDNEHEAGDKTSGENPYAGYSSDLYNGPENWLCRPDIQGDTNVCQRDISATLAFADGSTQLEPDVATGDEPVDCFYVYPTVSGDPGGNSDLVADTEIGVTYTQASRYRSACEIYAPLYRQVPIAALFGDSEANWKLAYADVLDAFKHYIAQGDGRGFILIGHSQGTAHLIRLIQEQIETNPWLSQRMIAAHLIGISVALPLDGELGATFQSTPPCTFDDDIHCFVNYVSFRENVPPQPETALFGITDSGDTRATCTHPNQLGGGKLVLDAYFNSSSFKPYTNPALNNAITTPFVKVPGMVLGECIEQDGKGYLAISVDQEAGDLRVKDTGGDLAPGWGLHLIDVNLAMGNLAELAQIQAQRWLDTGAVE